MSTSTRGRPRLLTDAQVKRIMDWYRSPRSIRELAQAMGVTQSVIEHCIHIGGHYKQASPESIAAVREMNRSRRQRLRKAGWL